MGTLLAGSFALGLCGVYSDAGLQAYLAHRYAAIVITL